MDEEAARKLFEKMLLGQGFEDKNEVKVQPSDSVIKELRAKTNLSIRRIAAITGLNKGIGGKTFDAKGHAERQQAAVVTDRFMENKENILELAKVFTK